MENKNKKFLTLSLISTLIAIVVHGYLASKFYKLNFGMADGESLCNINSIFNCDATSASSYAQVFNIPIALFGVSANLIVLFLSLVSWTGFADRPTRSHRFALLLSLFVALTSVVMGFISSTLLGVFCLYCIITYALSFISFFGLWLSRPSESTSWTDELTGAFRNDKWILGSLIAVPVLGFMFNSMALTSLGIKDTDRWATEAHHEWTLSKTETFDNEGLVLKPNLTNPTMTIVEFADFMCSHCKHAYPTLHAFTEARPDVQFIFKSFPLDGSCNPDPSMKGVGDGIRCRLALSVGCAQKVANKGWDAHHFIFDHQEDYYSISRIADVDKKLCDALSLPCDEMQACMESGETMTKLKQQAQEALTAKITGTPSIFVNGKLLQAGQRLPILEKVYQSLKK